MSLWQHMHTHTHHTRQAADAMPNADPVPAIPWVLPWLLTLL